MEPEELGVEVDHFRHGTALRLDCGTVGKRKLAAAGPQLYVFVQAVSLVG
jgi:hypothetical protein